MCSQQLVVTPMNSSSISGFSRISGDDSGELVAKEMEEGFLLGENVLNFGCFPVVVVEKSGGLSDDMGTRFLVAILG